jgi:hypothetical protein
MKKKNKKITSGDWAFIESVPQGLTPDENKKIKKLLRDELPKKLRNVNEGWDDGNPMNG